MKKFDTITVGTIFGVLALPTQSFAAEWVLNVTPTEAIVGKTGDNIYVQILVSSPIVNPANCAAPNSYMIYDPALSRSVLAISLTAIASERKIKVYVTDSCDAATGRPLISSIGLT